jgi:hypothetical protein
MSSPPLHCHFCKAPNAPFHFRKPGSWSQLSEEDRRYLRACGDCREKAREHWRAKFAPKRLRPAPAPPAADPPVRKLDPAPGQGDLFGNGG